jgi:hypothetical protein
MERTLRLSKNASAQNVVEKVQTQAQEQAEEVLKRAGWVEWLPRFGYITRGLLYATVGILAFRLATDAGGYTTDLQGAIIPLAAHTFGKVALIIIAVGLAGYALWGFARALLDTMERGTSPKGLAERVGFLISGITYAAFVFPTVRLFLGAGGGGETDTEDWTAWLMAQDYGRWIVGGAGVIASVGAIGQIFSGLTTRFMKDFKEDMSEQEEHLARLTGRIGMSARGIVFGILAWFLLQAAWQVDASEVRGLDGALLALLQQTYGPWLLGIVAAGLITFGVFSALSAKWIRVVEPAPPGNEHRS